MNENITGRLRFARWAPLLAGALAGAMLYASVFAPQAVAQVPDSGAQRNALIVEMQKSNQTLGQILQVLTQIRDQGAPPADKGEPGPRKP